MGCIRAEELLSINPASISAMSRSEVDALCISLADSCRDLREKLNKNRQNSSISPSTFIPGRISSSANQTDSSKNAQARDATPKFRKRREHGFGRTIALPINETSWPEVKHHLWLWVFTSMNTCLFMIGRRTKQMAQSLFKDNAYQNWLMSDGYHAYRMQVKSHEYDRFCRGHRHSHKKRDRNACF